MHRVACCILLILPLSLPAQDKKSDDPLAPLYYLLGEWRGHETGKSGVGQGERTYELILGGRYLLSRNRSVFEPQEKNPKGEVHEDWTIFSRDNNLRTFVIRQFNSEGYVNEFVLDSASSGEKILVFVSRESENAPPGLRARLTFTLENDNQFAESFELALPGKDFTLWLHNSWKRVSP